MGDGEDDSQEESMEVDKGNVEGMRPRPQPRMPTKAEIERHNIDHYPYASWCPACVDGAGRADKHVRGGEEQNEKLVIACDYLYLLTAKNPRRRRAETRRVEKLQLRSL